MIGSLPAALLLAAAAACHRGGGVDGTPATADSTEATTLEPVTVRVVNHSWNDVVISLNDGNRILRLGTVGATQEASFTLRPSQIAGGRALSLAGHAIGGTRDFGSPRFSLHGGERVVWTVEQVPSQSSLGVY